MSNGCGEGPPAPAPQQEPREAAREGALRVDPERSSIRFVGRTPIRAQRGRFERIHGELSPEAGGLTGGLAGGLIGGLIGGWAEAEVASVRTLYPLLTHHLVGPDFFDAERWPRARFEADRALPLPPSSAPEAPTHRVEGRLTIRGITRPLRVPARIRSTAEALTLRAAFEVDRQDYGVRFPGLRGEPLIEDAVAIEVELYAPR